MTDNKLADALDCFWNAAIGPARDSGDFSTIQTVGAIAEGFAAVSQRLREHSEAHDSEKRKERNAKHNLLVVRMQCTSARTTPSRL